ncbi:hypothetical protein LptCag_1104 [Leptospirillum ferriphilum]|uniref:Uncharacterized protein n=1 Tax=Leptospirillum ferriphilum TaxID=178606 RepID=A0A094YM70_9BACT|nr:hypothetical protein LptCag_1104 [Leptospirillum ferriphilum]
MKNTLPTENEHISAITPNIQHSHLEGRTQSFPEIKEFNGIRHHPVVFSGSFDTHFCD